MTRRLAPIRLRPQPPALELSIKIKSLPWWEEKPWCVHFQLLQTHLSLQTDIRIVELVDELLAFGNAHGAVQAHKVVVAGTAHDLKQVQRLTAIKKEVQSRLRLMLCFHTDPFLSPSHLSVIRHQHNFVVGLHLQQGQHCVQDKRLAAELGCPLARVVLGGEQLSQALKAGLAVLIEREA